VSHNHHLLRITPDLRAHMLLDAAAGLQRANDSDFAELDAGQDHAGFARDLVAALSRSPRVISPKYFYDAQGSALFDAICELPEYYPTRTELALLARHADEMALCIGPGADIVEFGAGSSVKVRLLLDALRAPRRFVPIDISGDHLQAAVQPLARDYPGLAVTPIAADFTRELQLPPALPGSRRVGFFPGSSIGNFSPGEAAHFLRNAAQWLKGGGLLIGVDLVKDPAVLHAAYNDAAGVTAAFNRNLLVRANGELGADFEPAQFAHYAFYEPRLQRVEMHLVSRRRQSVVLCGRRFEFADGETLHTENSYKFTVEGFRALALEAGFEGGPVWCDRDRMFSVHWLVAPND
jgi:dimethylhistidine N-methyltransferase